MGIYVKFYHDHSLNMVMSRALAANFENVYFSSNSVLNFKKSYQFGGIDSRTKKLQEKAKLIVEPLAVLIGLKNRVGAIRRP